MSITQLNTSRFGPIDIDEETVITFDQGLLGLEESTRSMVLMQFEDSPYFWLHSTTDPEVAMIVTDPWKFWPDYDIEVPEEVKRDLAISHLGEVEIMVIVSIRAGSTPDSQPEVTANLLGPIVVNSQSRQGRQLVLGNSNYSTRTVMES